MICQSFENIIQWYIQVFVGDLSRDTTKEEVEKAFSYYGKLRSVW